MRTIHLGNRQGGNKTSLPETEVWKLRNEGKLDGFDLYWIDGMPEWKPLGEFFDAGSQAPPLPGDGSAGPEVPARYRLTRNLDGVTSWLTVLLWVTLAVEGLGIVSNLLQYSLLRDIYTQEQADFNDLRQTVVGVLYIIVFLVTGIVFLNWIHGANKNCRGFGAQGMVFTPGWSVGYYFIPIVCFWKPYESMKEIYQVSMNPEDWLKVPIPNTIKIWWTLWVINNILGNLTGRMSAKAETIESLQASSIANVVSGVLGIFLCIEAVKVVSLVHKAQKKLVETGAGALAVTV